MGKPKQQYKKINRKYYGNQFKSPQSSTPAAENQTPAAKKQTPAEKIPTPAAKKQTTTANENASSDFTPTLLTAYPSASRNNAMSTPANPSSQQIPRRLIPTENSLSSTANTDIADDFNMIVNFSKLKDLICDLKCPETLCNLSPIQLVHHNNMRYGFCHSISVSCTNSECEWEKKVWTALNIQKQQLINKHQDIDSADIESEDDDLLSSADELAANEDFVEERIVSDGELSGMESDDEADTVQLVTATNSIASPRKRSLHGVVKRINYNSFDINTRSVVAFREIGCGLSAISKFCGLMNLHPPINKAYYNKQIKNIANAYEQEAAKSMADAGTEQPKQDITISIDGTYQRRGFKSMNGVVTAISQENKKVLDYSIATKTCKSCQRWTPAKQKAQPLNYRKFKDKHRCKINHIGSAGAMEGACAVKIYRRSLKKHNLR